MRPTFATMALLTALLATTAPVAAQDRAVRSDQDTLVALELSWNEALYRNDVALIEQMLADEFIATYPDGSRGDKAKELAFVAAFNQQVESSTHDDMLVKVYGNSAVVWFTLRLKGPKDGKTIEVVMRYVDVFVFRDGRWQCVSSQSTKVVSDPPH